MISKDGTKVALPFDDSSLNQQGHVERAVPVSRPVRESLARNEYTI